MLILLYLIGGLGLILISAEVFTNGVEWLGKRMKLSEGRNRYWSYFGSTFYASHIGSIFNGVRRSLLYR